MTTAQIRDFITTKGTNCSSRLVPEIPAHDSPAATSRPVLHSDPRRQPTSMQPR